MKETVQKVHCILDKFLMNMMRGEHRLCAITATINILCVLEIKMHLLIGFQEKCYRKEIKKMYENNSDKLTIS